MAFCGRGRVVLGCETRHARNLYVIRFEGMTVGDVEVQSSKLKGYPFAGRVMVSGTTSGVLYRTMVQGAG